jgi:hypothetical protein
MPRLNFFSDCVGWPRDQVPDLSAMIQAGEKITRETFLKHVDRQEMKRIEQELGYERDSRKGLTMAKDWHVAYFKSTLRGCPAVYFVWSAIEYVFTDLVCLSNKGKGALGMPAEERGKLELTYPGKVVRFMPLLETLEDLARFHPGIRLFEARRPERASFPIEEGIEGTAGNLVHPEAPAELVSQLKASDFFWGYDPAGFAVVAHIDRRAPGIFELFREVETGGLPVGRIGS